MSSNDILHDIFWKQIFEIISLITFKNIRKQETKTLYA